MTGLYIFESNLEVRQMATEWRGSQDTKRPNMGAVASIYRLTAECRIGPVSPPFPPEMAAP